MSESQAEQKSPEGLLAGYLAQLQEGVLADRRKARRWAILRTILVLGVLVNLSIALYLSNRGAATVAPLSQVALIRMDGEIGPASPINSFDYIPSIVAAFKDPSIKAVVLAINSPGGTPVQSSLLFDRLLQLKQEYNKPLIAVGADTMASGAYFIASAADKIYANRSSVVGSIGVVSERFGLVDLIDKLGVESRTITAGEAKARLSPFKAESDGDREHLQTMLDDIHRHFKLSVVLGRGEKLKAEESVLFTGDVWTGTRALDLGLIDELGGVHEALEDLGETSYRDFTPKQSPLQSILRDAMGVSSQWLGLARSPAVVLR